MSYAPLQNYDYRPPTTAKDLGLRFFWKEYRMLRGLWLAVAVLGVLMQLVMIELGNHGEELTYWLVCAAWATAALYSVGAAVTLFSGESEEQTRSFLLNLPGRWLPIFFAKVIFALISAIGMGITLCITERLINQGDTVAIAEFTDSIAFSGLMIFEAIAWGLLFSLLMKQPLLAAIAAIAATSISAQLIIISSQSTYHQLTPDHYRDAVPSRLLLMFAVFAVDLWLGQRWFQIDTSSDKRLLQWFSKRKIHSETMESTEELVIDRTPARPGRLRQIMRLLWQTWYESRLTMLLVVPLAILLMVSVVMPISLYANTGTVDVPLPSVVCLFLPALLGAVVFRADQRGDRRQFLVAHAARPRYVWFVRQMFWCSILLAILLLITLAMSAFASSEMNKQSGRGIGNEYQELLFLFYGFSMNNQLRDIPDALRYFPLNAISTIWTSFFSAFALGQLFSLLIRREILAGLLAILSSVLLMIWVWIVSTWFLSPWFYVLPIGLGAMAATWLRMPDWVVGRNRPRSWLLPSAALAVPMILIAMVLPDSRLAQLHMEPGFYQFQEQAEQFQKDRNRGRATGEEYIRLLTMTADKDGSFEREVDVAKLIELTKRPYCYFDDLDTFVFYIHHIEEILFNGAKELEEQGDLSAALDRHLARMRFYSQLCRYQPSNEVITRLRLNYPPLHTTSYEIDQDLLRWAQHPDQTSEMLHKAIELLQLCPNYISDPREAIFAEYDHTREVILGNQVPSFFNHSSWSWSNFLAYSFNQLPWERQRGLQALDIRANQLIDTINATDEYSGLNAEDRCRIAGSWWHAYSPLPDRRLFGTDRTAYQYAMQNATQATTSHLVEKELIIQRDFYSLVRRSLSTKAHRRGLVLQLALLAYRFDHQQYPESLDLLVPDYLANLPQDPYADKPFQYQPEGFRLPLKHSPIYNDGLIPAHTPLLWCVGISNLQPQETFVEFPKRFLSKQGHDDPDINSSDELEAIEIVRLVPTDRTDIYSGEPIILILPAIEQPDEAEEEEPAQEEPGVQQEKAQPDLEIIEV